MEKLFRSIVLPWTCIYHHDRRYFDVPRKTMPTCWAKFRDGSERVAVTTPNYSLRLVLSLEGTVRPCRSFALRSHGFWNGISINFFQIVAGLSASHTGLQLSPPPSSGCVVIEIAYRDHYSISPNLKGKFFKFPTPFSLPHHSISSRHIEWARVFFNLSHTTMLRAFFSSWAFLPQDKTFTRNE